MIKRLCSGVIILMFAHLLSGQSISYLPGEKAFSIQQRWLDSGDNEGYISTSISNYLMKDVARIALDTTLMSDIGIRDQQYILQQGSLVLGIEGEDTVNKASDVGFQEYGLATKKGPQTHRRQPVLKYFYKTESNFFQVDRPQFFLRVNPILGLSYGKDAKRKEVHVFNNTRGIELHATVFDRMYFYTQILENQSRFLNHIERRISETRAIPGNGLFKNYQSRLAGGLKGWDYLNSRGYIGYEILPNIALELGHGRNFIGDGIRSLFLSDYANNYFYLKFRGRFWKFNYESILTELSALGARDNIGDQLIPKKYAATHYLTYHFSKNVELGLFESVVYSRANHFEFQYLNPVILYRTVEQLLGSSDNALLGASIRWNIKNRAKLYGQVILDEFLLDAIIDQSGWWANKYGFQAGIKYLNLFGIPYLDLNYEYNIVRPYTYSHRGSIEGSMGRSVSSYSHYNQPLAHPLGANFSEHLLDVNYRFNPSLSFNLRAGYAIVGKDIQGDSISYGSNILRSTDLKKSEYDNRLFQGSKRTIGYINFTTSYEWFYNFYTDINVYVRSEKSSGREVIDPTVYTGINLRYNFSERIRDY